MADTLTAQVKLKYEADEDSSRISFETDPIAFTRTLTGDDVSAYATQVVGTSEEALNVPSDQTTPFICILNTDATNFVEYGTVSGNLGFKLDKGEFNCVRTNSTIYVKADTANVKIQIWSVEA